MEKGEEQDKISFRNVRNRHAVKVQFHILDECAIFWMSKFYQHLNANLKESPKIHAIIVIFKLKKFFVLKTTKSLS